MMAKQKPFRTQIELVQTYEKHQGFVHTATSDDAEDILTITGMEEGNKISLYVDLNDVYIEFDGDAQSGGSSMMIPVNTGYFDEGIYITERISMRNTTPGKNSRVRGILWGR